jgi:pyruvate kinase
MQPLNTIEPNPKSTNHLAERQLHKISRTKTIATVGPACNRLEMLVKLIGIGVDVFRLNMAHGSRHEHQAAIETIREASAIAGLPIGILIDLAGPKIRLGELQVEPLIIESGERVAFVRDAEAAKSPTDLTCSYAPLLDELREGHAIVLADGIARLQVESLSEDRAVCRVIDGGTIRSRQGVNLPATRLSIPALGAVDRENAIWAASQDIQFVSLSFVRNASEIYELKSLLQEHHSDALVVAKIEKQEALNNIESIVQATDVIMVARGDLGVEIAIEKTPLAQKQIIRVCNTYRKPVIVATQMLESMHSSKQPTRAEASDVANAILDGADACMLSGETAIGEFPLDAVSVMQKIMIETEEMFKGRSSRTSILEELPQDSVTEAMLFGAAQIARRLYAPIVAIASSNCETARMKSKQRDYIRTLCFTDDERSLRRMSLYWGVVPVKIQSNLNVEQFREFVRNWAKEHSNIQPGESIVIVADTDWIPGTHDAIMVLRV